MSKNSPASPAAPSRVIIDSLSPQIDGGRYPIKRTVGENVCVRAIIFCDGHDLIKARLKFRHADDPAFSVMTLTSLGNDTWEASFTPSKLGTYIYTVDACLDRWQTWGQALLKKQKAGQSIAYEREEGRRLLGEWQGFLRQRSRSKPASKASPQSSEATTADSPAWQSKACVTAVESALALLEKADASLNYDELEQMVNDPDLLALDRSLLDKRSYTAAEVSLSVLVEPALAGFSSWYEFFPRSCTNSPAEHGNLRSACAHLAYVAELGCDVVYLPPIHPIGRSHRKGKNNALEALPGDVGSPWAIGGAEGGHKALHPLLGNFADFSAFMAEAQARGLTVALDIALQCSPDHPYLKEHPEWFRWRSDGTIQHAENPPKKYEDIVPFDFEGEAWQSLWQELLSIFTFWIDRGVKAFRVDNPHTKPIRFWQWLIAEVRKNHPETLFLAEAFTRPHIMASLAKIGFSQSYTYFTWRDCKTELTTYLNELTGTELAEYFRPNFWPNTPDILTEFMSSGGRPVFMQKLILAATLSPNYGIYGPAFELVEHRKRSPHNEEYLDSEKYEIRLWDTERADSLAPLIRRINAIRRQNKALQSNRSLAFHELSNDAMLAFSKLSDDGNMVLVVVNLDPHHRHAGMVDLPLERFGLQGDEAFQVHDLISDSRYTWRGSRNYVELDPHVMPAHIFAVRRKGAASEGFGFY